MARYSVSWVTKTMIAVADTTNYTNAGYCTYILPGSATQLIKTNEVYIGGESTSSTPTTFSLARDHVIATTAFSGSFIAALDQQTTAPTLPNVGSTSTALPQRFATGHLLGLSMNTFGGIARWQARYGEEITQMGTAVDAGEISLSSITGTGICSGHILIEIV